MSLHSNCEFICLRREKKKNKAHKKKPSAGIDWFSEILFFIVWFIYLFNPQCSDLFFPFHCQVSITFYLGSHWINAVCSGGLYVWTVNGANERVVAVRRILLCADNSVWFLSNFKVFFAKSEYFKQLNFVWNTDDNENLLALGKCFSSNHWKLSMFSASEITFQSVLFLFFF